MRQLHPKLTNPLAQRWRRERPHFTLAGCAVRIHGAELRGIVARVDHQFCCTRWQDNQELGDVVVERGRGHEGEAGESDVIEWLSTRQ